MDQDLSITLREVSPLVPNVHPHVAWRTDSIDNTGPRWEVKHGTSPNFKFIRLSDFS